MAANSKAYASVVSQIPNQISLVIAELDPAPQALLVLVTQVLMVMTVAVVDIVLAVMDTATEALHHPAATTMTMIAVDMAVLHPELVLQLMTTHLPAVVVLMTPIVATTLLLTHMSMAMADLLHETTLLETIPQEMLVTLTMIVVVATDHLLSEKYVCGLPTKGESSYYSGGA